MENISQKAAFLKDDYTKLLSGISVDTPRKWGKMNAWQMIEHMAEYVRIANGRIHYDIVTPEDKVPRMQGFLASEKPFMENTPNSLMPDSPEPVKKASMQEAISDLQGELDHFFEVHQKEQGRQTANPFFGYLNYEQQVQLLFKHATHHLRQFGVSADL